MNGPLRIGAFLVAVPIIVVLVSVHGLFVPLIVSLGVVLLALGFLDARGDDAGLADRTDLVQCPNCRSMEDADRDTCRYCEEPLLTDE